MLSTSFCSFCLILILQSVLCTRHEFFLQKFKCPILVLCMNCRYFQLLTVSNKCVWTGLRLPDDAVYSETLVKICSTARILTGCIQSNFWRTVQLCNTSNNWSWTFDECSCFAYPHSHIFLTNHFYHCGEQPASLLILFLLKLSTSVDW